MGWSADIARHWPKSCISRNLDPCPGRKRGRQIGHALPDILTGVARRHPPGSVFRFAGWAPTGPGPARAVLGWPAGACWRPQQPKHRLHTPPELWNAFGGPGGGLGCLCHSEVAPCSNSLALSLHVLLLRTALPPSRCTNSKPPAPKANIPLTS